MANPQGLAMRRLAVAAASGAIALLVGWAAGAPWSVSILIGWDVATVVFLTWVWVTIGPMDAASTARSALSEDDSRAAADTTLLSASIASLVAVGLTLAEANKASGVDALLLTIVGVLSIALGWAAIHTTFTLGYARLYYTPPDGGIDFKGEPPGYLDFAYLALTIGMTFQVSDTDLIGNGVRRLALRHALTSYVFGTVIVAITVSSVASLLGR